MPELAATTLVSLLILSHNSINIIFLKMPTSELSSRFLWKSLCSAKVLYEQWMRCSWDMLSGTLWSQWLCQTKVRDIKLFIFTLLLPLLLMCVWFQRSIYSRGSQSFLFIYPLWVLVVNDVSFFKILFHERSC